jgi:hypothetical protein
MRLLFSVGNFGFLRNFEPALRLLAERGHDLHLVADRKDSVGGSRTIELLMRDYPDRIRYSYAPSRKDELWLPLATRLRLSLDYWRYLDPRYDRSPSLRARGEAQAPPLAKLAGRSSLLRAPAVLGMLRGLVRWCERAMPPGRTVEQFLRDENPDLLLMTPLLYFGSLQVEFVRAARSLGIRTVLGVGSWDHLTTKGIVHEIPDRVLVWNEMQRVEAFELHGIAPERVIVTGAQAYDHWFVQQPSRSRAEFCARVGVPDDRPLLLYLCSSPFITPHEVAFVRRWIEAVRQAPDPELRRAALLIRPHPQNAEQWAAFDPAAYEAVGIWPRAGANPVDRDARADYFDSMFYSTAVVGVNTSALIESGIVGRPVFSILADEFAGQQEGTLHFQHLKNVNGGLLTVGATMDEHVGQLASALHGSYDREKSRTFVEAFVRPHGLQTPAAARVVEAIEAEAAAPRLTPAATPLSFTVRRAVLAPAAYVARWSARRRQARRKSASPRPQERTPGGPQKILFALASPEYLRYYDSTMRLLADRGHQVIVGVNWLRERKHARLDLLDDDRIHVVGEIPRREDTWGALARGVRGTIDFIRYLHPRFADTPLLRDRMYRKVLPRVMRPLNRIHSLGDASVLRWIRGLQAVERAVPLSAPVDDFLRSHAPDVVIVSPLIDAASEQVDIVRASRAAGIPVVAAIASWDNLTNKGHMRVEPDLVTVWNDYQKSEAVELHGMPAERIVVTGAQLFDRWFDREPSMSRSEFLQQVGLPEDPVVLFTGSSVFIARSTAEVPFVRGWLEAMRKSEDPVLRNAAVLIRPHPFNADAWIPADFSDLGPVSIWPRSRYTPAAEDARTSLFDSLFFCDAVVGINTSAMIEASILNKAVFSLLTPEFSGTQEGTIHFRYLLPENGGFLRVANSVDVHLEQLAASLRDPALTRRETERFVGRFIRPHGLTTPCTPILSTTVEELAAAGPRTPLAETAGTRTLRVLLWPLAVLFAWATSWSEKPDSPVAGVSKSVARMQRSWRKSVTAIARGGVNAARRTTQNAGQSVRRTERSVKKSGARFRKASARVPANVMRTLRKTRYRLAMKLRGTPSQEAERGDGA